MLHSSLLRDGCATETFPTQVDLLASTAAAFDSTSRRPDGLPKGKHRLWSVATRIEWLASKSGQDFLPQFLCRDKAQSVAAYGRSGGPNTAAPGPPVDGERNLPGPRVPGTVCCAGFAFLWLCPYRPSSCSPLARMLQMPSRSSTTRGLGPQSRILRLNPGISVAVHVLSFGSFE